MTTEYCILLFLCRREADKDMVVKGFRIPKGTALMLAPYPMHVSPHNYIEPFKFYPERWLSETVEQAQNLKQSGEHLS